MVGRNIERLRKQKGIMQKDFITMMQPEGCDINPTNYSKQVGQLRLADDKELYIIAKLLNTSIDSLFVSE